ncbi:glycoside hydrolase superfamily [Lactifluus subvellereus]|nr:glycoside hydrolase superfamily [Lactifluus subvellereus]
MFGPRDPFATPEPTSPHPNFQPYQHPPGQPTTNLNDNDGYFSSSAISPHDSFSLSGTAPLHLDTTHQTRLSVHRTSQRPLHPCRHPRTATLNLPQGSTHLGRSTLLVVAGASGSFVFPPPIRVIWGSVIGLVALIAIGTGVGVAVSQGHKSSNRSSANNTGSGSGSGSTTNSSVVPQTNPNDPSTFVKDSRLKQSFYGIAYTPANSQLPNCGNSLSDVITDIQLISQLTKRIRLYGADCNQTALVLEAIKQTKVDLSVFAGIYPIPTDQNAAYTRQRDLVMDAIKTYGTDHIAGVTVGNEWMLNYLNANGGTDPNGAIGNQGAALLIANIQDTVKTLQALNLPKQIPVGNSDAGAYFNTKVLGAVNYGMANVHPWFANVSIDQAAMWTNLFFQQNNVAAAAALTNRPQMYIAETGWPTKSSDAGNANNGPSTASIPNLQQFLDTFVCAANKNGTGYFYFEAFDELWKVSDAMIRI